MLKSYRTRKLLVSLIFLIAGYHFSVRVWKDWTTGFARDFAVSFTAANALRNGISLYDHDNLRLLSTSVVGPIMADMFSGPFSSYIGLPTTAVFLLPF